MSGYDGPRTPGTIVPICRYCGIDLAFLCQIPISDYLQTYTLQALATQVQSFVTFYEVRACYTFAHESIMEAMMTSFGERHPQEVLEGTNTLFI